MEKKNNTLLLLLLVTVVLVAGIGGYLKYIVCAPLKLYEDEFMIAVPFLLMSDEAAQAEIRMANDPTEPPTEPATELLTEPPTEAPIEVPSEAPTEAPTEPIVIDESWFDDVLFIGDSRTAQLERYAPLGKAHYFCATSASVFDVRYIRIGSKNFLTTTLEGLLTDNQYGKVYIMLGINGIYMPQEDILKEYQTLIDLVREKQPDAAIILHSVMTVGRNKVSSSSYYSLESIYSLNEKLAELAVGDMIFYTDVNEWIADEEGYLPDDFSKDGCHLYGNYCIEWSQWLLDTAHSFGIK